METKTEARFKQTFNPPRFICSDGGFSPHECAVARGSKPPTLVIFALVGGLVRRSSTHQL